MRQLADFWRDSWLGFGATVGWVSCKQSPDMDGYTKNAE